MKFEIFGLVWIIVVNAQALPWKQSIDCRWRSPGEQERQGVGNSFKRLCPHPQQECIDGLCIDMWDFSRPCYSDYMCPLGTACSYYNPSVGPWIDPEPFPNPDNKYLIHFSILK